MKSTLGVTKVRKPLIAMTAFELVPCQQRLSNPAPLLEVSVVRFGIHIKAAMTDLDN